MKKHNKSSNLEKIIEDNYRNHPLYKAADCVCRTFQPQIKTVTLYEYNMFYETMKLIDGIKKEGEEFGKNHPKIARNYYDELQEKYPQSPVEERMQIANILLYFVTSILYMHDSYFGRTAELLNIDSIQDDGKFEDYIMDISNSCDYLSEEICDWINSYMALDNDEYLSGEIDKMFNGGKKKEEKDTFEPTTSVFSMINGVIEGNITLMYQRLCDAKWIDGEKTGSDEFCKLFSGKSNGCKIYLCKKVNMDKIYGLFDLLIKRGFISSNDVGYTNIIKSHFYNSENKPIRKAPKGSNLKTCQTIYAGCIEDLEMRRDSD